MHLTITFGGMLKTCQWILSQMTGVHPCWSQLVLRVTAVQARLYNTGSLLEAKSLPWESSIRVWRASTIKQLAGLFPSTVSFTRWRWKARQTLIAFNMLDPALISGKHSSPVVVWHEHGEPLNRKLITAERRLATDPLDKPHIQIWRREPTNLHHRLNQSVVFILAIAM